MAGSEAMWRENTEDDDVKDDIWVPPKILFGMHEVVAKFDDVDAT
uniref:Uncharacterized protein n=1 Tax=Arundo donax TaxID=35708 RepID=A0A0A8YJS7_ARUDO